MNKRYTYTLAALNKRAAEYELELVKGAGYFYWVHKPGEYRSGPFDAYIESIVYPEGLLVRAFSHAPEEFWDRELEAAIVQVEEWKKERASEFSWIKTREESFQDLERRTKL